MTSDGKSSIDCLTARQFLSAFHDGELTPDLRSAVSEHVEGCEQCAARLAAIRELSRMSAGMPSPAVPTEIWPRLEEKLAEDHLASSTMRQIGRQRLWMRVAAAALVAVMVSTAAVWLWNREPNHSHVAINFGHYLDEFVTNPNAAEQVLLSNYAGRTVSYDEAARKLRYQPVTPEQLPNGLSRKAIYLLRMPCCLCVQAIYQHEDGQTLAIFEHVDDQPVWFGHRPTINARCNGVPMSLVQVDDYLAATWKRAGRYVTVIGANDVKQVESLVAYLDDQQPLNPP